MSALIPITVVTGQFEDLVADGLNRLIAWAGTLQLVDANVPWANLSCALERHRPAVAIINFGSLPSPVALHDLHTDFPHTRLVVLANCPSSGDCNQLLSFGATACLSKETQARDIRHAIHQASRGVRVLPKTPEDLGTISAPATALLTAREADVLELLRAGKSNGEIALALHISAETVKTHAGSIYRKLGVHRRELLLGQAGLAGVPSREYVRTSLTSRGGPNARNGPIEDPAGAGPVDPLVQ